MSCERKVIESKRFRSTETWPLGAKARLRVPFGRPSGSVASQFRTQISRECMIFQKTAAHTAPIEAAFVGHKAMDGRGRVKSPTSPPAHHPRNEAASMDASKNSGVGL